MTKPRGSVIVRRFLAGESLDDLVMLCRDSGMWRDKALAHVENCIRRALNQRRARR